MLFRLRNAAHYAHFRYRTRALQTAYVATCNPDASCEIHTMLSQRDLPLYLVAIKSLLRFHSDVAVLIHSDGTVDRATVALLREHVRGCRFVEPIEADARASKVLSPALAQWRNVDAAYRRLMDTALWSRTRRRVIMDSDILVLDRPEELIEWFACGTHPVLLGGNEHATTGPSPAPTGHIQNIFRHHVPEISRAIGYPGHFLQGTTAGLYGCADELNFETIERLLLICAELKLPMRQWGADQCLVIYVLSNTGGKPLNPARYVNFGPEQVSKIHASAVAHFFGTYRFHRGLYPRLAGEVARAVASGGPV